MADAPPELSLATVSPTPIDDTATSPIATSSPEPLKKSHFVARSAELDRVITRFHSVIKSREGLDITLLFATEAARLVGAILELISRADFRKFARLFMVLKSRLPKSIPVTFRSAPSIPLAAIAGGASTRLQALVIILEEWQILSRLWGILDMWMSTKEAAEEGSAEEENKPASKIDTMITVMGRLTLTSFHLCEATAWLSSQNVLRWSEDTQGQLFGWSAKAWGAFSCVEAVRLIIEWRRKSRGGEGSEDPDWKKQWWKEFTHNIAWLPLAMHWNRLPEGLLPEILVAIFGIYPSMGYMRDIWEAHA